MHNIIEGAVNMDLHRDVNTARALQCSSIKAMPNLSAIGSTRGRNVFSICKPEEPNHAEQRPSGGQSGAFHAR